MNISMSILDLMQCSEKYVHHLDLYTKIFFDFLIHTHFRDFTNATYLSNIDDSAVNIFVCCTTDVHKEIKIPKYTVDTLHSTKSCRERSALQPVLWGL
jgi:hypothetical protein